MKYEEFLKQEKSHIARRKPRHVESRIQQACVSWFRLAYPKYLCFAVPNGGSRNPLEAANLKREGALAGVADLIILSDRGVFFVEIKTEKGRQQETQKKFQRTVERLGYVYSICRSLRDFQLTIERWIKEQIL